MSEEEGMKEEVKDEWHQALDTAQEEEEDEDFEQ
jgi:hypothetical protein